MSVEEPKKFIIKIVLSNNQNVLDVIKQVINFQEGEVRSLYLSPKGLNGEREMIIEFEGKAPSVNSLVKNITQIEGCVESVVTEFPAALIQIDEEVGK
ncbi:MAG: hypothetical protein QXX16_04765 [Nitrososphaerota archaeon]